MILKNIARKQFYLEDENQKLNIKQELLKNTEETNELVSSIIDIIQKKQLYEQLIIEQYFKMYKEIEFVYDILLEPVCIKDLYNEENEIKPDECDEEYSITTDFYEGFGNDIYQKQ